MCNVANHTVWCDCHTRPSLKQQLATAHREGWEQAKEQIIAEWELPWGLSGGKRFEDRMRAMEYKEKANDR